MWMLLLSILFIIIIGFTVNWFLSIYNEQWMVGTNDGWLGFWGSFLGTILSVLFAVYLSQIE